MAIIGGIPHFQTYPDGGINSKCRIQPLRAPWIQVSDFEAPVVGLRCCAAPPHPILGTLKRGGGDGSSQRWVIEEKKGFLCEYGWCIIVSSIGIIWFWWIFHHLDVTSQRNRSVELGDQRCKATKQTTSRALLHNLTYKWYIYVYINK